MLVMTSTEDKIFHVYEIFRRNALKFKRSVQFPEGTDPKKTYMWRVLRKFVECCNKEDIEDGMIPLIVSRIVKNGHETRALYKRGIAILNAPGIIEVCLKKLEHEVNDENREIKNIKSSYDFVLKEQQSRDYKDLKETLLGRRKRLGSTNIVRWFNEKKITVGFLALSKSCFEALNVLDEDELTMLPGRKELRFKRHKLLFNHKSQLRDILGSELGR